VIKILNAEPLGYSDEARQILHSIGVVHEEALDVGELVKVLGDYHVLIVRLATNVNRQVLDSGRCLKAVVSATTGLDHVDVAYAREQGVAVLSLQGEIEFLDTIPATAEHAWGLLLALTRRIPHAFYSVCAGEWDRDLFRGHDLRNRRLGLVGLGRIGKKVARFGMAFEMDVAAYDPYRADWLPGVHRCESLNGLLSRSDVLSLHVPLNSETRGLIGRADLALLPPSAVVVNTSRGDVLDETALVEGLESGKVGGAALDVVAAERDPAIRSSSPLLHYARSHDNLLITPHIGGATAESMASTEVFMAAKLRDFLIQDRNGGQACT
jgi:D-3-phosphoglycerate dehydrogenase